MDKIELIDEMLEVKFKKFEVNDFKLMYELVRWCDSYTRQSIYSFHLLKDFLSFSVSIKTDKEIHYYIDNVRFYFRKLKHRLKMEDEAINNFKEFLKKKFGKFIEDYKFYNKEEIDKKLKLEDLK